MDDDAQVRVALPPLPESVRDARAFVRAALANVGRENLADDAELAISEIVTNAVVHAATAITVTVAVGQTSVRVAVTDGSKRMPRLRGYADTAGTGRGLRLLTELAAAWGADSHDDGKTVWFDLGFGSVTRVARPGPVAGWHQLQPGTIAAAGATRPPATSTGEQTTGSRAVQLLNTPVLLYAAWRQHAEVILREFCLATLDRGTDEEAVRIHSDASDALALLDEFVPTAPDTDTAEAALAAATAPDATAPHLVMRVPPGVRSHFDTLDRALEDALSLADEEKLLAPPVQPELRLLRRWLCDQVDSQCDGAAPRAWEPFDTSRSESDATPLPLTGSDTGRRPEWDASPVTGSRRAVVAADDTSAMIAVSPAAVQLLGYDTAEQLLGRRLISVIPERFRQAHLAGFTFYLLTGKGALLDEPVTVPVLKRDQTETLVELTVRMVHAEDGRPVFVADLSPREEPATRAAS